MSRVIFRLGDFFQISLVSPSPAAQRHGTSDLGSSNAGMSKKPAGSGDPSPPKHDRDLVWLGYSPRSLSQGTQTELRRLALPPEEPTTQGEESEYDPWLWLF
jgi:hypothetical protein